MDRPVRDGTGVHWAGVTQRVYLKGLPWFDPLSSDDSGGMPGSRTESGHLPASPLFNWKIMEVTR